MNSLAYYIVHGTKPGQSMAGHHTLELYCKQFEGLNEPFEETIKRICPLALRPYRLPHPKYPGYYLMDRFSGGFVNYRYNAGGHIVIGVNEEHVVTLGDEEYLPEDIGLRWVPV